jgi:integrase
MSVRIIPARGGKGFEYDVRVTWPEGGFIRERGKCPVTGKDACRRWAEQRERVIHNEGKAAYKPLHAKRAPEAPASGVPTLAEFWPRVVQDHYKANRKKASTLSAAVTIFNRHLADLHARRLDDIATADVAALKGRLAEHSKKTANNVLSVLSRVMNCALEWGVIKAVPCRFGLFKITEDEMPFYEVHDFRRLVEAAKAIGTRQHLLVLLGGSVGMRRGEIIALQWSDLDLVRRTAHIRTAIWSGIEDTPKGNRARKVPLTPEVVAALKAQRAAVGELLVKQNPDARVLLDDGGGELSNRTVRNWLRRAQSRAGLPLEGKAKRAKDKGGAIHILRHTFCSHLAMAGVPAKAIQQLAGHQHLKTTMRYMHLSPANRNEAMDALARFYAAPSATEAEATG